MVSTLNGISGRNSSPDNSDEIGRIPSWKSYLLAGLLVTATLAIAFVIGRFTEGRSLDLLFLFPVIVSAIQMGVRIGLAAALFSVVSHDFVLVNPLFQFSPASPSNWVMAASLSMLAVATGALTHWHNRRRSLGEGLRSDPELVPFLNTLGEIGDWNRRIKAVKDELSRRFDLTSEVYPVTNGTPEIDKDVGPALNVVDMAALEWAARAGIPTGAGTGTVGAADYLFHPLRSRSHPFAVIALSQGDRNRRLSPHQLCELELLIACTALALRPGRR